MTPHIKILNGIADEANWDCGRYSFMRVENYLGQLEKMPRNGSIIRDFFTKKVTERKRARIGKHVPTYIATIRDSSTITPKPQFFKDGTDLDDICVLWSLINGQNVVTENHRARVLPVAREKTLELAHTETFETVRTIQVTYGKIRRRPLSEKDRSTILIYLETYHVRPIQVKVVLLTTILECLSSISAPGDCEEGKRYHPIIRKLLELNHYHEIQIDEKLMEQFVVELYRMRNQFVHGGLKPYRHDITIGNFETSMGRIILAARLLCKFSLASLLEVPRENLAIARMRTNLHTFFNTGSLSPDAVIKVALDESENAAM